MSPGEWMRPGKPCWVELYNLTSESFEINNFLIPTMKAKSEMSTFIFIAACPSSVGGQNAGLMAGWQEALTDDNFCLFPHISFIRDMDHTVL